MTSALFESIEPFNSGFLSVDDRHTLYFEEAGNPNGKPAIILHGGPGGGSVRGYNRVFDPKVWRIVQFDQRGCGQSTPHADLVDNTTWHSVSDIETLRTHLNIDQWLVFGGSWGATLSLAYGQTHPEACTGFVLRGVFMLRAKELDWYYQAGAVKSDTTAGAAMVFPDLWQDYLKPIPENERHDMMAAYYKRLCSDDPAVRSEAAKAWSGWEGVTSTLLHDQEHADHYTEDKFAEAFARIECHYFTHGGFFKPRDQLLQNIDTIKHLNAIIVQGRYDMVCPATSAWELAQAWGDNANLHIMPSAGHSWTEPEIQQGLVEAVKQFI